MKQLYDTKLEKKDIRTCTNEYKPVCGINNITYSNICKTGGIPILNEGMCIKKNPLIFTKPVKKTIEEFISDVKPAVMPSDYNDLQRIYYPDGHFVGIKPVPDYDYDRMTVKPAVMPPDYGISDRIMRPTIISPSKTTICKSNIDYACGINNITYDNSCKADVHILHKGKCYTIEEDKKNYSNAINSFKESFDDFKILLREINDIQLKIFNIIKESNKKDDKDNDLFTSNIILPNIISISDLIKIFKKVFILSRSSTNNSCNCKYNENFNFVHKDYITKYLI